MSTNPRLAFVLLTHKHPEQILHLCQRLTDAFAAPPIAIHHDFGQSPLDTTPFPSNVVFVEDWIPTRWARFSSVEALLKALRLLYTVSDPDWFIHLSASDYPIQHRDAILHDLEHGAADAYLDHRLVHYSPVPRPPDYGKYCFDHPAWVREAYDRYMALALGFFRIAVRFHWKTTAFHFRWHRLVKLFTPFDGTLPCFAGDFWITANRRAAMVLLGDGPLVQKLTPHFRKRPFPDEGYFHTILCNTPDLTVDPDNKRYTDWSGTVGHPRTLSEADFPDLLASGDHFARKFDFDPALLHQLDTLVDQRAATDRRRTLEDTQLQPQQRTGTNRG